jgi:DNA-binding transcriptional ArsR family regulator
MVHSAAFTDAPQDPPADAPTGAAQLEAAQLDAAQLDAVFAALSDATRRTVLETLGERSLSITELAGPHGMSLTGFMKHLRVLENAGLISRTKEGRIVRCELSPRPMQEAAVWLSRYEKFWTGRLDALARFLYHQEETEWQPFRPETQKARKRAPLAHPPPALPRRARQSLARVDRPASAEALVRPRRNRLGAVVEIDLRVGGRFRVTMLAADGETHDVSGTYLEMVPNRKLVFSWAWRSTPERESRVTVRIEPDGLNGCELVLMHEQFFDEAARDATTTAGAAPSSSSRGGFCPPCQVLKILETGYVNFCLHL